jgi:hypothetical protein
MTSEARRCLLDKYSTAKPEAAQLKEIKKRVGA